MKVLTKVIEINKILKIGECAAGFLGLVVLWGFGCGTIVSLKVIIFDFDC